MIQNVCIYIEINFFILSKKHRLITQIKIIELSETYLIPFYKCKSICEYSHVE